MEHLSLGNSGIRISSLAFGAWGIVGGFNWGDQRTEDSIAALRTAYEEGITLFDTAEGYGSGTSEELINRALSEHRDEIVLASKVSRSNLSREKMTVACENSLQRLGTDRIDLYQVHWPSSEIPFDETFNTLESLKKQGKILAYGVSNFGRQDLSEALAQSTGIVSNQMAYSLLFRAVEFDIQSLCEEKNISILCYSPLMQGILTGKFASADDVPDQRSRTRHFSCDRPEARHGEEGAEKETFEAVDKIRELSKQTGVAMAGLAIQWLMHQAAVTSVIVGGRNAQQVRMNVKASEAAVDKSTLEALNEITQPLKERLGDNADMWQGESRIK